MHLTPKEIEKLMLHQAGFLAQKRYARGVKLNYVETIALVSAQILEFIRDGESVSSLMDKGKKLLGINDVLPNVADLIHEVQVEGTFPDGTKLVTIHEPVCRKQGDPILALYGSGLKRTSDVIPAPETCFIPGEVMVASDKIILNDQRQTVVLEVCNKGDRPVQIGSHYPVFESNKALAFEREASIGKRLDIPSGTAVRFEPGEIKKVQLVEVAGDKIQRGGNDLIDGSVEDNRAAAMKKAHEMGFLASANIIKGEDK